MGVQKEEKEVKMEEGGEDCGVVLTNLSSPLLLPGRGTGPDA